MKATANQDVDKYQTKMDRVRQRMDIAQKEFKHLENTLAVSAWLHGVFSQPPNISVSFRTG